MSKSGSKIREQVAHFLVDIHNHTPSELFDAFLDEVYAIECVS